ncbi:MAG: GGDEF domain-containing protein [Symbiopectobacterium sp.]|uniref:GGDEF domain-containing protein n=1 Tax=Symbiopectobacterium sp. TaxID=2952789 RepID=UPI0039EC78E0
MAGLKYQLLKLISHPVSVFFFFGSVVFSAALFVIYHERQAEWDTQRYNLDNIIHIYQSYNTSSEVKDSDIRFLSGSFLQVRVRTLGFNTRDTQAECISHLSQLDLTFNDMTVLHLCKDKLPAMGEYAGKGTYTTIFPLMSPLDDAYWVAERARVAVSNATSASSSGQKMKLSVSIGLVEYHIAQEDLAQVMKRADEKLYLAKRERNRA